MDKTIIRKWKIMKKLYKWNGKVSEREAKNRWKRGGGEIKKRMKDRMKKMGKKKEWRNCNEKVKGE